MRLLSFRAALVAALLVGCSLALVSFQSEGATSGSGGASAEGDRSRLDHLDLEGEQSRAEWAASKGAANGTGQSIGHFLRLKRRAFWEWLGCPRSARGSGASVKLVLYSRDRPQDISFPLSGGFNQTWAQLVRHGFEPSRRTLIYLHGFTQSAQSKWLRVVRSNYDSLAAAAKFNLLFVDYSAYSSQGYGSVVARVPAMAKAVCRLLLAGRQANQLDPKQLHILGFSLGGQVAANLARCVGEVGLLTGIDAAGVCFERRQSFAKKYGLRAGDADLVVARHYDIGKNGYGLRDGGGHLDIYVNGGSWQPFSDSYGNDPFQDYYSVSNSEPPNWQDPAEGELFPARNGRNRWPRRKRQAEENRASHYRASWHEARQVRPDGCMEVAYACSSRRAFLAGECATCGPQNQLCYQMNTLLREREPNRARQPLPRYPLGTRMFIETNDQPPFCLHHYQIRVSLREANETAIARLFASGQFKLIYDKRIARVVHQLDRKQFTYLLLLESRLEPLPEVVLSLRDSKADPPDLKQSIESVELNYMSHACPEMRRNLSQRFCAQSQTGNQLTLTPC